jgi:glycosyltransferase involved in cell wall biosynthesis
MNIAFIVKFSANSYSGGRIHALALAYAFACVGYDVDIYTNTIPIFLKDLPDGEAKERICFYANRLFLHKIRKPYVHIVVVPHLACKIPGFDPFVFYPFVRMMKKVNKCLLWYIDFESPNWINETDTFIRNISDYRDSNKLIKNVDIILSTTKIGSEYAKVYYKKYNPQLQFHQLYLSINSTVANKVFGVVKKSNSVCFFGRFNLQYKNPTSLINIIRSLPCDFTLKIIGNKSAVNATLLECITNEAKKKNIVLAFYSKINDEQKFTLLASARLLLFTSKFEGYGLPPIEAQYVETPVLCSDLPVLREVNPLARFTNFDDVIQLEKDILDVLGSPPSPASLHESIAAFATYERFSANLKQIINSIYK